MGYATPDVYYQPEAFLLVPVAELDYSSGMYEFDIRVVWAHVDGRLFTARDGGCSCPTPFEDYTSLESLETVTSVDQLAEEAWSYVNKDYSDVDGLEVSIFLNKVQAALDRLRAGEVA